MPKATELYNLHIINPDLSKEWHPSRNGDLNPRNVPPGSGKKVWWICAEGHGKPRYIAETEAADVLFVISPRRLIIVIY